MQLQKHQSTENKVKESRYTVRVPSPVLEQERRVLRAQTEDQDIGSLRSARKGSLANWKQTPVHKTCNWVPRPTGGGPATSPPRDAPPNPEALIYGFPWAIHPTARFCTPESCINGQWSLKHPHALWGILSKKKKKKTPCV